MESRLQELTQKLYQEGIEKANNEAGSIIEKAKADGIKIIEDAKKEAALLKQNATKEAEQLTAKTKSEIKMAGDQAVSILKQEITDLLLKNSLSKTVSDTANNKDLIIAVIKEIAGKWDASTGLNLNLILSDKLKTDLEKVFKTEAADLLKNGVELKFDSKITGGFKIVPKDNSFVLSFTDEDFINLFQSFLRPKAKEILFPGA